ncbi:MAG: hypothetical protein COV08_00845 [Candidatus Vogelbacteria bacterium CG10_big_fil_rev_8_21_14_0_10_49_38]|uniref:Uncharacterized protein n=1 Tax=Candidatus Vogelbacteria bacterium CG10_big_fil_rev_8_21_14_0_10_49_38 TaxID=1975043 RepID=A0A2H0RII9_9BACT|nr:MAG: hypothetical protein BK006_00850 [bacterium CG10_49_38]PIR46226.1 MAG: hypothetical protein COV08_00845 [Candidatus Vogelbacteria bacterium CG10_big_fil_rev_8_21_14_0_10_49_38]
MKSKFAKIISLWSTVNLLLLAVWVGLFFLIDQKNQAVTSLLQANQPVTEETDTLATLVDPERQRLMDEYLINASSTIVFLEELEQLGRQTGIDLSIGQAVEQGGQLGLSLKAEASFDRLGQFLTSLELLPYAVRVNRLELRQKDKTWQGDFFLLVLQNEDEA